jgi:hypothetical protein
MLIAITWSSTSINANIMLPNSKIIMGSIMNTTSVDPIRESIESIVNMMLLPYRSHMSYPIIVYTTHSYIRELWVSYFPSTIWTKDPILNYKDWEKKNVIKIILVLLSVHSITRLGCSSVMTQFPRELIRSLSTMLL